VKKMKKTVIFLLLAALGAGLLMRRCRRDWWEA